MTSAKVVNRRSLLSTTGRSKYTIEGYSSRRKAIEEMMGNSKGKARETHDG